MLFRPFATKTRDRIKLEYNLSLGKNLDYIVQLLGLKKSNRK